MVEVKHNHPPKTFKDKLVILVLLRILIGIFVLVFFEWVIIEYVLLAIVFTLLMVIGLIGIIKQKKYGYDLIFYLAIFNLIETYRESGFIGINVGINILQIIWALTGKERLEEKEKKIE